MWHLPFWASLGRIRDYWIKDCGVKLYNFWSELLKMTDKCKILLKILAQF